MNNDQKTKQSPKLDVEEELKQLVIQRLKATSDELNIVIGNEGDFTREELIRRVESGDKIGKEVVESEIEFLKALTEGKIYASE